MGHEFAITDIFGWGAAGGSAGLSFFAVRWVALFFAGRFDKREAAIIEGTETHIARLERHIKDLMEWREKAERELEECQRKHIESEEEVGRLRGILQGYGDARQLAALQRAAERNEETKT